MGVSFCVCYIIHNKRKRLNTNYLSTLVLQIPTFFFKKKTFLRSSLRLPSNFLSNKSHAPHTVNASQ
jgi:hypothetical protein